MKGNKMTCFFSDSSPTDVFFRHLMCNRHSMQQDGVAFHQVKPSGLQPISLGLAGSEPFTLRHSIVQQVLLLCRLSSRIAL